MAGDAAGGVERPRFEPLMPSDMGGGRPQFRKVPVPSHRFAPLKKAWMEIYTPVYEHMKVDIRMNLKARALPISLIEGKTKYRDPKVRREKNDNYTGKKGSRADPWALAVVQALPSSLIFASSSAVEANLLLKILALRSFQISQFHS